ncbi:FabD/lysophospholipase-like protein [Sporormia fimetaria CBS 119925]|uniref:FabD/lysophospholipase-like protein n=1 Tax=Sporormia fimetaria CBS 119925 TaxID=1340428 RepID=A0A6A6VR42_9PLEO|nr:FabD/lysophospholipase-like protein [Sporormia fimetaria CBS 119925]
MASEERPLLLLSLDGGGVRGLSTLMVLKRIMKTINEGRSPDTELEPWQVFEMIGGTSTGGIIAIMLGRLRMRLEDCENAYLSLSKSIFTRKRSRMNLFGHAKDFVQADGRFDSAALETAIKEVVRQVGTEDMLLKEEKGPCKVFVVAVRENNSEAALLRSYRNPRTTNFLYDECKIWEACRATSAATTFFAPIQIGKYGQKFVDGAVRYNNPVQLIAREAEAVWPGRAQFILSIGTGSAPGLPFKGNLKTVVDGLKAIATETERTADDFHHAHREMVQNDLLFRFNVYHGLSHIGLEEYKEISAIADATEVYLDHGETLKKLEACIGRLQATIAEGNNFGHPSQSYES